MSDTSLPQIIQYGTNAARIAFTPSPASGSQVLYLWYTTDTTTLYLWNGSAWVAAGGSGSGISSLTGDVTGTGPGATATTIAAAAVSNSKLANMAQSTIKGRASGAGTGAPTDLSGTQVAVIVDAMVGDTGTGGTKGEVPAPASGDAAAGKFLKADGTWAVPPGTGGSGTVTHTGSLTADELVLGNGTADIKPLGSAGTTTTVLHGNGAGAPSFGAVVEADITLATSNTTNDVSTTKHGFAPTLPNDATKYLDGTGNYTVPAGSGGGGVVVQVLTSQSVSTPSGTTGIPIDDTIPQITEGDQYFSITITPGSSSNRLIIEGVMNVSASAPNGWFTMAFFQDSTANAIAASTQFGAASGGIIAINLRYEMTAGTTSATTFTLRAGVPFGATMYMNGNSGGRFMGGVMVSSMTVTELTP
jgi:hypothetical protein